MSTYRVGIVHRHHLGYLLLQMSNAGFFAQSHHHLLQLLRGIVRNIDDAGLALFLDGQRQGQIHERIKGDRNLAT